jgi:hypothetical protein
MDIMTSWLAWFLSATAVRRTPAVGFQFDELVALKSLANTIR